MYSKKEFYESLERHKESEKYCLNDEMIKAAGFDIEVKDTYSFEDDLENMPTWFYMEDMPEKTRELISADDIIDLEFTDFLYGLRKPMERTMNDCYMKYCILKEYQPLINISNGIVKKIAGEKMRQALVIQTSDNKIYEKVLDYSGDSDEEEQSFLAEMEKDSTVIRMVCCWCDGSLDLPSYSFRKKLCDLNKGNERAQMLLLGKDKYILKSVSETFPKHKN